MANTVWYVTTDNLADSGLGDTTLYVYKWDGATFTLIDSATSNYDEEWVEPPINLTSRDGISVVVLQRRQLGDDIFIPEVRVYQGETLLRVTLINFVAGAAAYNDLKEGAKWMLLDANGNIHVIVGPLAGVSDQIFYDCISSDKGATFTPVEICTLTGTDSHTPWLVEDTDGTLWFTYKDATAAYKSTNSGTTWSSAGIAPPASTKQFALVNDVFFAVVNAGSSYELYKSTDFASWGSSVLTMPGAYANFDGVAMAHDGAYYYLVCIANATNTVYRSSDGTSWTSVGSFASVQNQGADSQLLVADDGTLYFIAYYSETNDTYHFMSFWYSEDDGATWTPVPTPFWVVAEADSSPGGNPPYIPWYSCPQGILLPTTAAESPSLSPSQSPSVSPSQPIMPINPYVMLTWSDDGGMTWSNEYWRPVGRIGEHRKRLIWRQLGRAKDRVFKIAVSDPCKWIFIDSIIDADEGTSRR